MTLSKPVFDLTLLLPDESDRKTKDLRNRFIPYITWANENGYTLDNLGLAAYREHLKTERGYADTTVKAHLATIRGLVKARLDDSTISQVVRDYADKYLPLEDREAFIRDYIGRIHAAIAPSTSRVKVAPPPPRNMHLDEEDITQLFFRLDPSTPMGLRDTAAITLMGCLGLRPNEVCALDGKDLCHDMHRQLALHVPPGRGCTERLVPYGEYDWVLEIIDLWLNMAEIESGPIFRGFYKGGNLLRDNRLASRAVEQLLGNYPIDLRDELVVLKPLDLRHAYARHLYRKGVNLDNLSQRLGLKSTQTVLDYIGIGGIEVGMYDPNIRFEFEFNKLAIWRKG
jgi:integrase